MGASMSTAFDYSIQKLAFLPPPKGYNVNQNVNMVRTMTNDLIATRITSSLGRPYVHGSEYNSDNIFFIFSHGNGDDLQSVQDYVNWLATTFSANVLSYDYVNYGCSSPGLTSEENMSAAITAVFEYATNTLQVPASKICLIGKSIGTAPTCHLAAQPFAADIQGVILISPLASGIRALVPSSIASRKLLNPLDSLFCPSLSLIKAVNVPVFVIHGYEDKVINIVNARILVKALSRSSEFSPLFLHAGHNDIEDTHPITLREYIGAFLQHCVIQYDRKHATTDALVDYEFE